MTTTLEAIQSAVEAWGTADLTQAQREGIREAARQVVDGLQYPVTVDWIAGVVYGAIWCERIRAETQTPMAAAFVALTGSPFDPSFFALLVAGRIGEQLLAGEITP